MNKKIIFSLSICLIITFISIFSNTSLFLNNNVTNPNISKEKNDNLEIAMEGIVSLVTTMREDLGIQKLLDLGYDGTGVTVGIIDSGVTVHSNEFDDRVLDHKSFINTNYKYLTNITSTNDLDNHGTGVASLIIGNTYGMAPGATLVSAKLFDGGNERWVDGTSGEETSRAVVAAIKWLVEEKNVSIINLSIGQYQNMYNEGREYWINKYSLENKVLFTVSSGNEGNGYNNFGSIGNPGISLQAITAGTIGSTSFTSNGPRYDNALKPDVSAPGSNVAMLSSTGSVRYASGTSFSSPLVAGTAASLISALKANHIDYTPGTIKAALVHTAYPSVNSPYRHGSGLINASAAFGYILSSTKTDLSLPDIITSSPDNIPFFPIDTVFNGQRIGMNVTLISSGMFQGTINILDLPETFFQLPNQIQIYDTTLLSVTISIPNGATPGYYEGLINITTDRNEFFIEIPIAFQINIPDLKVLVDFTHSGIINEILTTSASATAIADPWTTSTLWGKYQKFFYIMTENNVSLTSALPGELENISYLETFDFVSIFSPATKLDGKFSDWWNDLEFFPNSALPDDVLRFTNEELFTINDYVENSGGNVQVFASYPLMTDISEFNRLLNMFNISYQNQLIKQNIVLQDIDDFLQIGPLTMDYIGGTLNNQTPFEGELFENFSGNYLYAFWNSSSNGSIFVSGSTYFLDFGLYSSNNIQNFDFYAGLLEKNNSLDLLYFGLPVIAPLPPLMNYPILTTSPSSRSESKPNSSTTSEENDTSLSVPLVATTGGFFLLLAITGILGLKYRRNFKREL